MSWWSIALGGAGWIREGIVRGQLRIVPEREELKAGDDEESEVFS